MVANSIVGKVLSLPKKNKKQKTKTLMKRFGKSDESSCSIVNEPRYAVIEQLGNVVRLELEEIP